ncbi:Uncharacterised protein [Segatella copri]|nr:Uncharacterised protein [Segatella copri]
MHSFVKLLAVFEVGKFLLKFLLSLFFHDGIFFIQRLMKISVGNFFFV